jgi:hypothetical protein
MLRKLKGVGYTRNMEIKKHTDQLIFPFIVDQFE